MKFLEQDVYDPSAIPFPHSYWVVPGKLLAGQYPGDVQPEVAKRRIRALLDCGIRHVINLMEANEVNHQGQLFVPYAERLHAFALVRGMQVEWNRYAIPDGHVPTRDVMHLILDEIDAANAAGRSVYVHCWGGKGRTGTVVGCYLIRHNLATGDNVLERIIELRKNISPHAESPETDEQRAFVRSWKTGV